MLGRALGMIAVVRQCGAMVTASAGSRVGWGQRRCSPRLTPKFDIFRLTTRGLDRLRRGGNRRAVISRSPSARAVVRWSGGKSRLGSDLTSSEADGAGEGEPVGVESAGSRGVMHQGTDGVMDQQVSPDFLLDPAWRA